MITLKLRSIRNNFSIKEQFVADYILENLDNVKVMSIQELSNLVKGSKR